MTTPEDNKNEFDRREAELQERERKLRLREMEAEIYQQAQSETDPPLYNTKKHNPPDNSIKKLGKKIVKFAKFGGFVVAGIAIIKIGFFVGMWVTYLIMASIVAAVGYQIFLKED